MKEDLRKEIEEVVLSFKRVLDAMEKVVDIALESENDSITDSKVKTRIVKPKKAKQKKFKKPRSKKSIDILADNFFEWFNTNFEAEFIRTVFDKNMKKIVLTGVKKFSSFKYNKVYEFFENDVVEKIHYERKNNILNIYFEGYAG